MSFCWGEADGEKESAAALLQMLQQCVDSPADNLGLGDPELGGVAFDAGLLGWIDADGNGDRTGGFHEAGFWRPTNTRSRGPMEAMQRVPSALQVKRRMGC